MSENLKQARAEIEAILLKHDIAGHVILHELFEAEVLHYVAPSYSILSGALPIISIRSKHADYDGDAAAQQRDQAATANMVAFFAEILSLHANAFRQLQTFIDIVVGAEHGETVATPEPNDTPDSTH